MTSPYRKHNFDENFFQSIDTEQKAYWLGFIAADGCVHPKHLSIRLHSKDHSHLRSFALAIGAKPEMVRTYFEPKAKSETSVLNLCSTAMLQDLSLVGITPRKSLTVSMWQGPEILMRHYWRGAFEGDGGIYSVPQKSQWHSKQWLIHFCGTFSMVNGFSKFCKIHSDSKASVRSNGKIWTYKVGGTVKPKAILSQLYANNSIALPRKAELARQAIGIECFGNEF